MKIIKRLSIILLLVLFLFTGCSLEEAQSIEITGESTVEVGKEITLSLVTTPEKANLKNMVWSSSEEGVVTLTPGKNGTCVVRGQKDGNTIISVTNGTVEDTLVLTVVDTSLVVTDIKIDNESLKLAQADPKFDFTKVKIKVTYSNEKEELINLDSSMFSEEDLVKLNKTGYQTVTVNYRGFSKKLSISIPLVTMKTLEVVQESIQEAYDGTNVDYTKIKIVINYSDLSKETMKLTEAMMNSADLVKLFTSGTHTIGVTYNGLKTSFEVTNQKDYYHSLDSLSSVSDGVVVAVKANYTYHGSRVVYLQSGETSVLAQAKTASVISNSSSIFTDGNELILVGSKAVVDGMNTVKDVVAIVEASSNNDIEIIGEEIEASDVSSSMLYKYVTFKGYSLSEKPGIEMSYGENKEKSMKVMVSNKDIPLTASKGTENLTIVVLGESNDSFAQSIFVKYDEMAIGHELIIENVFVTKDAKGNIQLVVTPTSNIDYKKVEHEFQGLIFGEASQTDNEEFNDLLDELFLIYLGDSAFNFNWFIYDKAGFIEKYKDAADRVGIDYENLEVEYTDYSTWTVENEMKYYEALKERKAAIEEFDKSTLSVHQQLAYNVLLDNINAELKYFITDSEGNYTGLYYGCQLGSYLGYQAQIPTTLAEYRFDEKQDIEDYFKYLEYTPYDFDALFKYEKDKVLKNEGNQMSDFVIDLVIEQCDNYIFDEDTPYLITAFGISMEEATFLTDSEKEAYIARNTEIVEGVFREAYVTLKENLIELKKINVDDGQGVYGALCEFEYGKAYYEALFQDKCGSDLTIQELISYIEDKIEEYDFVSSIYNSYDGNLMEEAGLIAYQDNGAIDYYASLHKVIPFLQDVVGSDFADLPVDLVYGEDILVKEVHQSMQDNSSPAAYYISPIDANTSEVIYINPRDFSEVGNYMYQTLAHEGYPGHLYQNVATKNSPIQDVRKMLSYTGYSEGWANYVENYVPKYIINNYEQLKMFEYTTISSLSSCMIDIGVNYLGWGVEKIIEQYGLTVDDVNSGKYAWSDGDVVSMDDFEEIYYFYVEVPTNYLMYFFSSAQLLDIKAEFKEQMGVYYSDKLFHTIFVEAGDCSWTVLRDVYNNYAKVYGTNGTAYNN